MRPRPGTLECYPARLGEMDRIDQVDCTPPEYLGQEAHENTRRQEREGVVLTPTRIPHLDARDPPIRKGCSERPPPLPTIQDQEEPETPSHTHSKSITWKRV